MAVEKKKDESKSSVTPLLIIGAIFAATILGIYFVSQSGQDDAASNSNTGTNAADSGAAALELYAKAPPGASPSNFLGAENASVVVEEFADFQCGTCAVVHPKMKEIISHYGGRIKFVFRNYPLVQTHPNAYEAAVAAEAAGAQGKFWQMQEMIFTNQGNWSNLPNARSAFKEYAGKIGLDVTQFENDILGGNTKLRVDADMQRGRALNVSSTPTVFINGKLVPFPQIEVASLKTLIDAELAKTSPPKEGAK